MCIFCDAIEKTSKAKQLCRFRFLPSAFFRFSVSWFLFLLLSQLQFTQTDKAFDGQLTSALPSVALYLSLCGFLPHDAAGVAVNVNATQPNSKSGSAERQ